MSGRIHDDELIKGVGDQRVQHNVAVTYMREEINDQEYVTGIKYPYHTRLDALCDLSDNYTDCLESVLALMAGELSKVPACLVDTYDSQKSKESLENYGARLYMKELPKHLISIEMEYQCFLRSFDPHSSSDGSSNNAKKSGGSSSSSGK